MKSLGHQEYRGLILADHRSPRPLPRNRIEQRPLRLRGRNRAAPPFDCAQDMLRAGYFHTLRYVLTSFGLLRAGVLSSFRLLSFLWLLRSLLSGQAGKRCSLHTALKVLRVIGLLRSLWESPIIAG